MNAIYAQAKIERRAGALADATQYIGQAVRAGAIQLPPTAGPLLASLSRVQKDTILTQLQDKAAWAFAWNAGVMY